MATKEAAKVSTFHDANLDRKITRVTFPDGKEIDMGYRFKSKKEAIASAEKLRKMPWNNPVTVQHIASVPAGWKVRTVAHPSGHQARIAFPPGPRKRGSGRVVEILHPDRERNPDPGCIDIYEVAVGHAGPPELGSPAEVGIAKAVTEIAKAPYPVSNPAQKSKTMEQVEKMQAKAVRFLRDVVGDEDKADEIEGMTPDEYADKKRVHLVNPSLIAKVVKKVKKAVAPRSNSKKGKPKRPRRNLDELPEVKKVYETFQGKPASEVTVVDFSDAARDDFAHLGWCVDMVIQPYSDALEGIADPNELTEEERSLRDSDDMTQRQIWDELAEEFGVKYVVLDFSGGQKIPTSITFKTYGDGVRVVSASGGSQIYFLGGKQDISEFLPLFGVDGSKDLIGLGVLVALTYLAAKRFPDDKEVDNKVIAWQHILGEEGGDPPLIFYNKLQKRLFLAGGSYSIERPGIVN